MKQIITGVFLCLSAGLFAQGEAQTSEPMSFAGGDLSACKIVFTRESGEEITFWNPELGQYADPNEPCTVKNDVADNMFQITFQMGETEVVTENGGTAVVPVAILVAIELLEN